MKKAKKKMYHSNLKLLNKNMRVTSNDMKS